jgi:hypothetical protein
MRPDCFVRFGFQKPFRTNRAWTEVPVREETGTESDARMWEIAENLRRAELTVIERAEHIEEWRKLTADKGSQVATPVAGGTQPVIRKAKLPKK